MCVEFVLSVNSILYLFLSVLFVSFNFHPNQASISHFSLILLLPQPIIISSVCFSVSTTLFLTLDLYLFLISLLFCEVSFCFISFKPCLKKSRFSADILIKLVPCTCIPFKKQKTSTKGLTLHPLLDLFSLFPDVSNTDRQVTGAYTLLAV